MKVGDIINHMGMKARISRVIDEDHYFLELGPENNRYEVEIKDKRYVNTPPKKRREEELPGW